MANAYSEKYATVKKANVILIGKIDELKEFLTTNSFNMGEKEINKYYGLKDNEKAQLFKKEYEKKTSLVCAKIDFSLDKLDEENIKNFVTELVNNYAKMEDGYFDILNTARNEKLTASSLFKCEVILDYYKSVLNYINEKEDVFNKTIKKLNSKEM